jgi:uncharacterized protein YeaO (DUF488 family)
MPMSSQVAAAYVKLKRAYEPAAENDGLRILVDRLWPRGVSKAEAALDRWEKDISPSTALRKWFGHDPARWQEFRRRYAEEVRQHPEPLGRLRALARKHPITLVYSAHDEVHNDAVVLRDLVLGRSLKRTSPVRRSG